MPETDIRLDPKQWGSWRWRVANLYSIVTDDGLKIKFVPNQAQLDFMDEFWYCNICLKGRQFGFTTLIGIIALDRAVFNANQSCGIIAQTEQDVMSLFRNKIKFPYENLPDQIRERVHPTTDSKTELILSNGSSVAVGQSFRGGTKQFLHISEFGYICQKHPEKAREIVTGALNTVKPGQYITIESTAKGRSGYFYDYCMKGMKMLEAGTKLTPIDFKLQFFPWWQKAEYTIDHEGVVITQEMRDYFKRLNETFGIVLTDGQKAWYAKKKEWLTVENGKTDDDMKSEFPSYPEEAFEAAILGSIYGKQMSYLRANNRIKQVPWVPSMPVNTFWDLGTSKGNAMCVWFHQWVSNEHRMPRYYEAEGEDIPHFVRYMQSLGYLWGKHYLPHDAENTSIKKVGETMVDRFVEAGIPRRDIIVVPRIEDLSVGIELTRKLIPQLWIDESNCDKGIKALEAYQFQWNENLGAFRPEPLHNWASNGADALRQMAQGWEPAPKKLGKKRRERNWRVL